MKRLFIIAVTLVIVALACGLSLTAATNSAAGLVGELANIEMAQAMRAQAHATQLATAAGLAGQVIVFIAVLAGVVLGGLLMFIGARLITRKQMVLTSSQQPLALEDRQEIGFTRDEIDVIFSNWR